jgi:hypothetical protein
MKKFLIEKANLEERNRNMYIGYRYRYHETINPNIDYKSCNDDCYGYYDLAQISDDKYYTYVYRIGVLYMWDANKCDFAELHIAFQTDKNSEMVYLGKLDFKDGENMDLETTVKRIAFSMIDCVLF